MAIIIKIGKPTQINTPYSNVDGFYDADGDDYEYADGEDEFNEADGGEYEYVDDYESADGDIFHDIRGRKVRRKRKKIADSKKVRRRKVPKKVRLKKVKRKLIRPVSKNGMRVITLGSGNKNNFKKSVLKALDGKEFYNAEGNNNSVEFGL